MQAKRNRGNGHWPILKTLHEIIFDSKSNTSRFCSGRDLVKKCFAVFHHLNFVNQMCLTLQRRSFQATTAILRSRQATVHAPSFIFMENFVECALEGSYFHYTLGTSILLHIFCGSPSLPILSSVQHGRAPYSHSPLYLTIPRQLIGHATFICYTHKYMQTLRYTI